MVRAPRVRVGLYPQLYPQGRHRQHERGDRCPRSLLRAGEAEGGSDQAVYEVSYVEDKAYESVVLNGVRLTDSILMISTMSESGVVFPTETGFASCQVCRREGCPRRTAPFDEAVWRAACAD